MSNGAKPAPIEAVATITTEPDDFALECNLLPPLPMPTSEKSQRYRALWRKAFAKIKLDRMVKKVGDDILLFGTQNELMDQDMRYKANIDELIEKKAKKEENFRKVASFRDKSENYRCLIHPSSLFRTAWNVVLCALLAYTAFVMPWRIAFETVEFWDGWAVFEVVLDSLFFVDVVMNFFTMNTTVDGKLVQSHWEIAKQYLFSWFIVDVTACIPFPLIEYGLDVKEDDRSGKYNSLVRLFRLPRLYKLFRIARVLRMFRSSAVGGASDKLTEFLQMNSSIVYSGFSKLSKFLLSASICVHVMGCMWFFSARISSFAPGTWVNRFGFLDEDKWSLYLLSVYWAVTTVTTVGYGDISPGNDEERLIGVLWMLVGVGCYSFVIGSLSSLLTTIDKRDSILQSKLVAVQNFSKEAKLSKELKRKMIHAVRRNSIDRGLVWSDKLALFSELPKSLRYEVATTMYKGIYSLFPLFAEGDCSFVSFFMPLLQPAKYHSEEILYREGDFADEVYFIAEGRINLITKEAEIVYKSFLRGSYIGEIEVVLSLPRVNTAQCFGDCLFLKISRNDFRTVLKTFPTESKHIKKRAEDRLRKNTASYRETVRLLEMKRERGTLRELAGRRRLSDIEEAEELAEEHPNCRAL